MTQETLLDNSTHETDPGKDYLSLYIGEGKKYGTDPEQLAKAYFHAESALRNRERTLDQIREDYLKLKEENASKPTLEEVIKRLDALPQRLPVSEMNPNANVVNEPKFNPDELKSLVSNEIVEFETRKKQSDNFNFVKEKLTQRFGANYQTFVQDQLKDLGITADELNDMARKSPSLALKALGVDRQTESFDAPPRSQASFRPQANKQHKKWSDYKEMKKTNPKLYYDPKIQNEIVRTLETVGEEAFYDVD